ncbi:MAG: class I SAM-dependent methyltransferase [Actinomycetota bacterium]
MTERWACPVCGSRDGVPSWRAAPDRTEEGVDPAAFRPSSERFGRTAGLVLRCPACGHRALARTPPPDAMAAAYRDASDEVSLREEAGQVETARRDLRSIERFVEPGGMLDVGCWTGSFLVAGRERGWEPAGVEPSTWASDRARSRGVDVRTGELADHGVAPGTLRLVALRDVIEHLADPREAIATVGELLEPGGAVFVATPDAGSRVARVLGRQWWSVLPMHVQYFTRDSLCGLLAQHGFRVRSIGTHPKVFSARYYAERLGGYGAVLERIAVGAVSRIGAPERLVAPDFRDRMAVIATRER